MSRRRHGARLRKYSLSPARESRRVITTSWNGTGSPPSSFEKCSETSARFTAFRAEEPWKITSSIFAPRSRRGALLAEHPAHGVRHVRLAAAVRSDDRRDARVEEHLGRIRERLEAVQLEFRQPHLVRSPSSKDEDRRHSGRAQRGRPASRPVPVSRMRQRARTRSLSRCTNRYGVESRAAATRREDAPPAPAPRYSASNSAYGTCTTRPCSLLHQPLASQRAEQRVGTGANVRRADDDLVPHARRAADGDRAKPSRRSSDELRLLSDEK